MDCMTKNDETLLEAEYRNKSLRSFYESAYAKGAAVSFSNWAATEADAVVSGSIDWAGRQVLDVGCGVGRLAILVRKAGAERVVGVDYAAEAIRQATEQIDDPAIEFHCVDIFKFAPRATFDVIVSLGTIEHMDRPDQFLTHVLRFLRPSGKLILTCPHFLNIRGFVWMTLAKLLDVPMSLSDLHFIHPWDMERWAAKSGLRIEGVSSIDGSRGNGERLLEDFSKRLPNALRDAGLETDKIEGFLQYLAEVVRFAEASGEFDLHGATALYVLKRQNEK
ncbi:MAG: Ubiquinone biosynthesis O-methyltransferase [Alphaproteobacteria bacterium MarineAlpha4_Bin2]|nr:MAG: Ubiquinone biosynthesis O-methyltransferase [Alphaproteobacteria bacterium MarineAlpha4_Bin2]